MKNRKKPKNYELYLFFSFNKASRIRTNYHRPTIPFQFEKDVLRIEFAKTELLWILFLILTDIEYVLVLKFFLFTAFPVFTNISLIEIKQFVRFSSARKWPNLKSSYSSTGSKTINSYAWRTFLIKVASSENQ